MHVNEGRGEECGWGGGGGQRKTATATMLATILRGAPAVHLPFKGFSNRQAQRSSRSLQSLVCGSQAPHPTTKPPPPPNSIGAVCMFCMRRQKWYSFKCALAL